MKHLLLMLGLVISLMFLFPKSSAKSPNLEPILTHEMVVPIENLDIHRLQQYLFKIGFLGDKNGVLDQVTYDAVHKYLKARGMAQADYLLPKTIEEMGLGYKNTDLMHYYAE